MANLSILSMKWPSWHCVKQESSWGLEAVGETVCSISGYRDCLDPNTSAQVIGHTAPVGRQDMSEIITMPSTITKPPWFSEIGMPLLNFIELFCLSCYLFIDFFFMDRKGKTVKQNNRIPNAYIREQL